MGGKGSKNQLSGTNPKPIPQKKPELTETDYNFLTSQTGMSRPDIKLIFDQFNQNNPDGKLDRNEFTRLYNTLRPEPPGIMLDKIIYKKSIEYFI
jgi:hypothetical protein